MKLIPQLALCAVLCVHAKQATMEPAVHIRIRVLNPAQVPEKTFGLAREIATRILRTAGIEPEWLDCDAAARPCRGEAGPGVLWLQLLRERPHLLEPDTAGYALVVPNCVGECGYAAVSYPTVQQVARQWNTDPVLLLGAVITHELGHLLLGSHSHSKWGVMTPHFSRQQLDEAGRGMLLFDDQQAQHLREAAGKM